ncbi:MAG: hypothetical protein WBC13_06495 [Dokdonella sp.]|jgi:hypothetical protein|uniref:hypothetical protein n=1 Tax=Dokdonella sp. TaxID=2291710 RepID=UPI002DD65189|nr:hypothetical protein [Dokdonella sp.]
MGDFDFSAGRLFRAFGAFRSRAFMRLRPLPVQGFHTLAVFSKTELSRAFGARVTFS